MSNSLSKSVAFHTLGCKVNHYETEAIWQLFKDEGYERKDFDHQADVYVINTCTVTNTGDKKSRQVIRRAVRQNPDAVICVTGCMLKHLLQKLWQFQVLILSLGHKIAQKCLAISSSIEQSVSQLMQYVIL